MTLHSKTYVMITTWEVRAPARTRGDNLMTYERVYVCILMLYNRGDESSSHSRSSHREAAKGMIHRLSVCIKALHLTRSL
jgi:hypothetical protein